MPDHDRLGAVVQLVPGPVVGAAQVRLTAQRADEDRFALRLEGNARLEEAVNQHGLGQLEVPRQRVEVSDERRVGVLADL